MKFNSKEKLQWAMAKGNQMNIRLTVAEMSFREFSQFCSKPQQGGKHESYFLRGVPIIEAEYTTRAGKLYENGRFRHDSAILSAGFLIVDADNSECTPIEMHEVLESSEIVHCIYTTYSHRKESNNFRVVIPCEIANKDDLKIIAKKLISDLQTAGLGIEYVTEMGTWSQAWFLPTRHDINDGLFEHHETLEGNYYVPKIEKQDIEHNKHDNDSNDSDTGMDGNIAGFVCDNKSISGENGNNGSSIAKKGRTVADMISVIMNGSEGLHHSIRDYANTLSLSGVPKATVVETIRGLMFGIKDRSERISTRYNDIERIVRNSFEGIEDGNGSGYSGQIRISFDKVDKKRAKTKELLKAYKIDWPPGMMGELAKSVYDFSLYPNKTISIVTSLGLVAGVCGRRWNIYGSGLNIYMTLLMNTGGGKSVISKYINRVLNDANIFTGASAFTGSGRYTGPRALMNDLAKKRCMISVFTEAGFMFRSTSGDQDGLTRSILDLYGSSGYGCVSGGGAYSDEKNSIPSVAAPCFSMVNESTPDIFLEALKDGSKTGEINRMNVFRVEMEDHKINRKARFILAPEILDKVKMLMGRCMKTQAADDPDMTDLVVSEDMFAFADKMKKQAMECQYDDDIRSSMLQRSAEKAFKIAGLCTVFNNRGLKGSREQKIDAESWQWAQDLHKFEMRGLDAFFKLSDESDMHDIVSQNCFEPIRKLLSGEYRDRQLQPDRLDRECNRVPRVMLRRALRTNKTLNHAAKVKAFRGVDAVDMVVDYLVKRKYAVVKYDRNASKEYVVFTPGFLELSH